MLDWIRSSGGLETIVNRGEVATVGTLGKLLRRQGTFTCCCIPRNLNRERSRIFAERARAFCSSGNAGGETAPSTSSPRWRHANAGRQDSGGDPFRLLFNGQSDAWTGPRLSSLSNDLLRRRGDDEKNELAPKIQNRWIVAAFQYSKSRSYD